MRLSIVTTMYMSEPYVLDFYCDRARLAEGPALMATAVEELLRAYAPVTMARLVRQVDAAGGDPALAARLTALEAAVMGGEGLGTRTVTSHRVSVN